MAQFAGRWIGHTRILRVEPTGRAIMKVDDGCCHRAIRATYRLSNPRAKGTALAASARIIAVRIFYRHPRRDDPKVGDQGTVVIRRGQFREPFFGLSFCDAKSASAGLCGA